MPVRIIAFLAVMTWAESSRGTTISWNNVGTDFATGTNWTGGIAPANSISTDVASFGTASPTNQPKLNGARSVKGLVFASGAGAFTFSGTNTAILTLGVSGIVNSDNTGQTLDSTLSLKLGAAAPFTVGSTGGLTINSAVNNNAFLLTLNGTGTGTGTISGAISGTAGLTKSGSGTWALSGTNSYSGVNTITGGILSVSNLENGSTNSGLGASSNAAGNLIINGGTLQYTGAAQSTNRLFQIGQTTSGQSGTIDASGTGALTFTNTGSITYGTNNRNRTLILTGTNTDANTLAALIANDGSGSTTVTKSGVGTWLLSGNNSYTGATTITGGILSVSNLKNGSTNSNIGRSSNAATSLVLNGGTLQYTGAAQSTNRLFQIGQTTAGGTGTIDASGSGALTFTNTGSIAYGTTNQNRNLVLTGTNTGSNTLAALIANNGSNAVSVSKTGVGTWVLSGNNSYTGATTITDGILSVSNLKNGGTSSNIGASTKAATKLILDGGTLQYTGAAQSTNRLFQIGQTTAGGTGTIDASGSGALSFTNTGSITYGTTNQNRNLVLTGTNTGSNTLAAAIGDNGTGVTSVTKSGTGTWVVSGNSSYTGGTTIAASGGILNMQSQNALGTGNITVNSGGTLQLQGGITAMTEGSAVLTLNGTGSGGIGALNNLSGANLWNNAVALGSDATISNSGTSGAGNLLSLGPVDSTGAFDLNGHTLTLGGTGDFTFNSNIGKSTGDIGSVIINTTGTVTYFGYQNFYTGSTTVNAGTLLLTTDYFTYPNKGILGSLIIGDGIGSANTAVVTIGNNDEISNSSTVTINSDGRLNLATYNPNEDIGALNLSGGHVDTGTGNLYINGDVTVTTNTANQTALIDGNLNLSGGTRTFTVANGGLTSDLTVNARINSGSIIKAGSGIMTITSDNTIGYGGTTQVAAGTLNIQNSTALGQIGSGLPAAGTTVDNGATLQLEQTTFGAVTVGNEALSINGSGVGGLGALNSKAGNNSWAGAITLASSGTGATIKSDTVGDTFTLSNSITGAASVTQDLVVRGVGNIAISGQIVNGASGGLVTLTKNDSGTVSLTGANTFTGAITVNGGTLSLGGSTLGGQNAVSVGSGATLSQVGGGASNTISALTGSGGTVSIASGGTVVVNNSSSDTFGGVLSGTGTFEKTGAGTFTFTNNVSTFNFGGTVKLDTGTLEFTGGTQLNSLTLANLTIGGGTLLLTGAYINVGTLNITGNTVFDFGNASTSILNATNVFIAAGAQITIQNWTSETDFFYALTSFQQTAGPSAVYNAVGAAPENQVLFNGTGANTTWTDNYPGGGYQNFEIRPVPEPTTYGALFLASCVSLLSWQRYRRRSKNV